jgi:adenylate kinase
MRILVTGVSGLDRERAWLNVDNGSVFDLGSMMLALAKERHMDFDEDTILHAGQDTLAALRAAAIARINLSAGQNLSDEALIISTHSVFARVDGLAEGLLPADVKEIKPDLWVTLIDGPQTID